MKSFCEGRPAQAVFDELLDLLESIRIASFKAS